MMINGVGGSPQSAKPASSGGDVAQLEQQKKAVQDEIKRVKDDDKLKPDAKEKKLEMLEKKLQRIEEAIQKASASSPENSQMKTSAPEQTAEEMQAQMRRDETGKAGNIVDEYA